MAKLGALSNLANTIIGKTPPRVDLDTRAALKAHLREPMIRMTFVSSEIGVYEF
ncbi:MAG: hypothetical protein AAF215_00255 [Cyanobacteria bacterium P01_A01_bin.123]